MPFGAKVLLIGAGPTGLILSQLMKVGMPFLLSQYPEEACRNAMLIASQMGGAGHVTLAANKGIKMDIARKIEAADSYIDLDRSSADAQWAQLKKDNPRELAFPAAADSCRSKGRSH